MWDLWWTKWYCGRLNPSTSTPRQSFHLLLYTSSSSSFGAGTIGQIMADEPSGLSLTPPQERERERERDTDRQTERNSYACPRSLKLTSCVHFVLFYTVMSKIFSEKLNMDEGM
jgi:hypothetical protein